MRKLKVTLSSGGRTRGFTLTEVLIAAVINFIVCIGAVAVFIAAAKMQHQVFNHNTVDAESRKVENWLVTDLRAAMTVEDEFSHDGKTYTSDGKTLILRLPAIDGDGVPIQLESDPDASASDFIVYYHDDTDTMKRLLVRHKDSMRDGRNTASEEREMAESSDSGIIHTSAFSVAPGVLGPVVVHYEFRSSRTRLNRSNEPYTVASAGSVCLRNRPDNPATP